MYLLIITAAFILTLWGLISKNVVIRMIARIITGGLALLSLAGMILLFSVGQRAHWTSDGPGMLIIMIGVAACGLFVLVFGNLALLSSPPQDTPTPLSFSELTQPPSHKEKGRLSE